MTNGIDVSAWQYNIDWTMVKHSKDFAIMRIGVGMNTDSKFAVNYKNAKAAGVPIGGYWYSKATTVAEAKAEAEKCLAQLSGKQFEYPIYYDVETEAQGKMTKSALTTVVKTFLDAVEKAGYFVGLYSFRYMLTDKIDQSLRKRYAVWVADTRKLPKTDYPDPYGMWQYSWEGAVKGISTNVDLDSCYVDYPTIIKQKGLNGFAKQTNPTPAPTIEYTIYTVVSGDTLSKIASRYKTTVDEIVKINGIANPDRIYVGQKIRIIKK